MESESLSAQTISLTQDLIRLESVNPVILPTGSGERVVADRLATFCRDQELPYEIQEVVDGRPNFVTWVPGRDPKKRLLFVAHTDTVPVDPRESDPFSGEVRDGRVY